MRIRIETNSTAAFPQMPIPGAFPFGIALTLASISEYVASASGLRFHQIRELIMFYIHFRSPQLYLRGMKLKIDTNFSKIAPTLQKIAKEEIPFATAKTLTDLAKQVNVSAKEEMRRKFHIRDKYVLNSFRLVRAEKRDWPNCKAEAGTRLKFMEQQTEGGVKRDKTGLVLGVPILGSITRPTIMDRIPQSLYAKKVLNFKKNDFGITKADFFGITDRGGARLMISQKPAGRRTNRRLPMHLRRKRKGHSNNKQGWIKKLIYVLTPQVNIPARFKFEKLAKETVEKNYEKVFKTNLENIFKV